MNSKDPAFTYAERLGIEREDNETELSFRQRVARKALDKYNDSLLATEILTGKEDYHEFDDSEQGLAFLVHMLHSAEKKAHYKSTYDTYYDMPWHEFNNVLRHNGFEREIAYVFSGSYDDEFAIWANHDKGILLRADSSRGRQTVNGANINFELGLGKKLEELDHFERHCLYKVLDGCSWRMAKARAEERDAFIVHRDAREGLADFLFELDGSGFKPNSPWEYSKQHFLWLLDYEECGKASKDYEKITADKIRILPEKTRRMIGRE